MKIIIPLLIAFALLTGAAKAGAAITATPFSDPTVPVVQGTPLTTLFTNTAGQSVTVDFNANINYGTATVHVSDGSSCPWMYIKRGLYRNRCRVPAGGEVLFTGSALSTTTTHAAFAPPSTAYPSGTLLASVSYLTFPKTPADPVYVPVVNCRYKGWGLFVAPAGCPTP